MTANSSESQQYQAVGDPVHTVLHLFELAGVFVFVNANSIRAAQAAQETADAAPSFDDFGELRRSGNRTVLEERLDRLYSGVSLESYVAAIEQSAGRTPVSGDIGERLAAVSDVDYDGDDDAEIPADSSDVRSEYEIDNEIEDYFGAALEARMCDDVPADVLAKFKAVFTPMHTDLKLAYVESEQVEEMTRDLEARGFTVVRGEI